MHNETFALINNTTSMLIGVFQQGSSLGNSLAGFLLSLLSVSLIIIAAYTIRKWYIMARKVDETVVLPFENATGDEKYNGKGVSDSLISELQWINEVLQFESKGQYTVPERLPIESGIAAKDELREVLLELRTESQSHANALANIANINIPLSNSPISLGPLMNFLANQIMGDNACLISGSVQKYGKNLRLVSHIKHKNEFYHCEANNKIDTDKRIDDLFKDLATKIAHKLSSRSRPISQATNPDDSNIDYLFGSEVHSDNPLDSKKENDEVDLNLDEEGLIKILIPDEGSNEDPETKKTRRAEIEDLNRDLEKLRKIYCVNTYRLKSLDSPIAGGSKKVCQVGRKLFHPDDIKNPRSIIIKLCDGNDPLSRHLMERYRLNSKRLLSLCESDTDDKKLKIAVADELNRLIQSNCLYEKESFGGIVLSSDTKNFLDGYSDIDCSFLNFLLIKDAYPFEFKKTSKRTRSWKAFKCFLESLKAFNDYSMTQDPEDLLNSAEKCEFAFAADRSYKVLFDLSYNLGLAFFERNNYKKSLDMFEQAVSIDSKNATAYSAIGLNLRYLRRHREALEIFQIANYLDPRLASPWNLIGNIFFDLGCYAEDLWNFALASYYQAIKLEPENSYPWLYIGLVYYRFHHYKRAKHCLHRSIDLAHRNNPDYPLPLAYTTLASCYKHLEWKAREQRELNKSICSSIELDSHAIDPNESHRNYIKYISKVRQWAKEEDLYNVACYQAIKENCGQAIESIRKSLGERTSGLAEIMHDPDFDFIKEEKEFQNLYGEFGEDKNWVEETRKILKNENYHLHYVRSSFEAACREMGDTNEAIQQLELAFKEEQKTPKDVERDDRFDFIRQNQEFKDLLSRYRKRGTYIGH